MGKVKKSKRRSDSWIGVLLFLAAGAACGMILGLFIDKTGAIELPFGRYMLLLAGLLLTLYAAMFIQIIIHEAGHLVFGLATGYEFLSFRVASFMWVRTDGGMKLRRLSIAGTGGQCLLAPPDMKDGKIPYVLYNLGGSLMNLISAALFAVLSLFCRGLPYPETAFLLLAVIGIGFALTNGIPLRMGTIDNDGRNVLSLGKSPAALRSFWVQMKVNEMQTRGVRIKDMPPEWFRLPEDGELGNSMVAVEAVLYANRLMDERLFDEAAALIDRLGSMDTGIVGVHMGLLRCDRIYCGLLKGEDVSHMRTKEQLRFEKQMKNYLSVVRTEYARLLLEEKDGAKAEKLRLNFERLAKSFPFESEAESERELMERARAAQEAGA